MLRSGTLNEEIIVKVVQDFLERLRLFEAQRNLQHVRQSPLQEKFVEEHDGLLYHAIKTDQGLDLVMQARKMLNEDAKEQLARRNAVEYRIIAEFADAYLKRHNITPGPCSPEYRMLCSELLKANIRLDTIITEHLSGNHETDYDISSRSRKKTAGDEDASFGQAATAAAAQAAPAVAISGKERRA